MPVRKIKKNYLSVTGNFYSIKNQRHIASESKLERDFFLCLEFDKNVIKYEEQPFTTSYCKNNRQYKYTPDCLVFYRNKKPCIFEIKYSSEIREKQVFLKEKFDQIEEYLEKNDMDFSFFTELDIEIIKLENIRYLYSFSSYKNINMLNIATNLIKSYNMISLNKLLNDYSSDRFKQNEILPYIWKVLLMNKIEVDLNKKINKETIIKVIHE